MTDLVAGSATELYIKKDENLVKYFLKAISADLPKEDPKIEEEKILVTSEIPIKLVSDYLVCASFNKQVEKKPIIISIGSGSGQDELNLQERLDQYIVCIDPTTESGAIIKPHFKTVEEMLNAHQLFHTGKKENLSAEAIRHVLLLPKELIGNVCLFINMPLPNSMNKEKVAEGIFYDIDAIRLLKPISVVLVYESKGSAGSSKLLQWIEETKTSPSKADLKTSATVDLKTVVKVADKAFPTDGYKIMASYSQNTNKASKAIRHLLMTNISKYTYNMLYLARKGTQVNSTLLKKLK